MVMEAQDEALRDTQFALVELRQILSMANVDANVTGRIKSAASIWCKMRRKKSSLGQILDLGGLRIIVPTPDDCYLALGVVETHWQPLKSEFNDYVATPKANGYQSLHTTILSARGKALEVQIRTSYMHSYAMSGHAAHWRYKKKHRHAVLPLPLRSAFGNAAIQVRSSSTVWGA